MRFLLEILGALVIFLAIKRWADHRGAAARAGGGAKRSPDGARRVPGEVVASSTSFSRADVLEALSPQQLAELSPKERAFMLEVLRGLEVRGGNAEGVTTSRIPGGQRAETAAGRGARSGGAAPAPAAPLAPPPPPDALLPVRLYCPACAAPLGDPGRKLADLSECHGCGRELAVRPDGDRLVVTLALGASGERRGGR